MEYTYKQGDLVKFDCSNTSISGEGMICGVALNPQPVIGAIYIVEYSWLRDIDRNPVYYEFTHIAVPECFITKL
jgi:hypothetical protein